MTQHELVYFDGKGRAEAIRIMLHAAGIDFKDTRLRYADWEKSTTPLGFLPVLILPPNHDPYCQSQSLLRYAGKHAGFYPENNPIEALLVDQAMECINEALDGVPHPSRSPQETKRARQEYQATTMTRYASFLEDCIRRNGSIGFVPTPSIADLVLMGFYQTITSGFFDDMDKDFFDSYPRICATVEAIEQNEKVVAYYASLSG